jgi:hypothetical protein
MEAAPALSPGWLLLLPGIARSNAPKAEIAAEHDGHGSSEPCPSGPNTPLGEHPLAFDGVFAAHGHTDAIRLFAKER